MEREKPREDKMKKKKDKIKKISDAEMAVHVEEQP